MLFQNDCLDNLGERNLFGYTPVKLAWRVRSSQSVRHHRDRHHPRARLRAYISGPGYIIVLTTYFTHLADFGVPLFFFVSGLLLAMRYYEKLNLREFYTRRVVSILPPVLAFSLVYIAFNWFILGQHSIAQQLGVRFCSMPRDRSGSSRSSSNFTSCSRS